MIGIGIDSATTTGWAVASRESNRERLLGHGVLDLSGKSGRPSEVVANFVAKLAKEVDLDGTPVAIELPYMGHGKQANVVTLRTLARLCGRWEQAFGERGADVYLVAASDWQRRILGARFGGTKRDEIKKAAQLWALGTFRVRLTQDEADACAIAADLLRENDMEAKLEEAKRIGAGACARR